MKYTNRTYRVYIANQTTAGGLATGQNHTDSQLLGFGSVLALLEGNDRPLQPRKRRSGI